jgi:hypothetical protein
MAVLNMNITVTTTHHAHEQELPNQLAVTPSTAGRSLA